VDQVHLAQGSVRWRAFVNMVSEISGSIKDGKAIDYLSDYKLFFLKGLCSMQLVI
jgi:hypothetical protein